jgi:FixJ family two-component response regulator
MARDALVGMVEHAGYPAVAFANPAGALARIAEQRPALILLDMMMPDIDGADFLRRLQEIHEGVAVPVVIVSAIGHLLQGMRRGDAHSVGGRGRPVEAGHLCRTHRGESAASSAPRTAPREKVDRALPFGDNRVPCPRPQSRGSERRA